MNVGEVATELCGIMMVDGHGGVVVSGGGIVDVCIEGNGSLCLL